MNWKEIYKPPFHSYDSRYVWSNNGTMTFTFDYAYGYGGEKKIIEDVVNKLNGDSNIKFDSNFELKDNIYFYYKGNIAFCVRGWGRLTGAYALHLSNDDAKMIQNDFAKWVLETLNS